MNSPVLTRTSQLLHPSFRLNGLDFTSAEEVLNFSDGLLTDGDEQEVWVARFLEEWFAPSPIVTVCTSGSTGKPKDIELQKEHMINSARATGSYFKTGPNTRALLCLSAEYIAGKMMLVRAMILGWDLHVVAPSKYALIEYDNDYDFVAMVPYQVWHSLPALEKVKKLIVGGGHIAAALEEDLQRVSTEVFATYGMTETSTHIAIRRINGPARTAEYYALPGVRFAVDSRSCLIIKAPSIVGNELQTNDVVELKSPSSFIWLGRFDNVINTGGIKLYPESIESRLRPLIHVNFIIASEPDEALGERVILVYEGNSDRRPDLGKAMAVLESYERPKRMYAVSHFACTETGKFKRKDIIRLLRRYK